MARTGQHARQTQETNVSVSITLDGSGVAEIDTGIGMLDHMLRQLSTHGLFDLDVRATGDLEVDSHHTVEDVAICLGRALDAALGDKAGITRMGWAIVPLDEALALVSVDLSGRGAAAVDVPLTGYKLGTLQTEMIPHFLDTFAAQGNLTLHVRLLAGENDHHKAEAVFKALARVLSQAVQLDPRRQESVPSSKGSLE
ncbi:MAG: imidazoleglycerol-phosphate dehydratase HisB [Chloroflexi bacterium]|nr:imidazoleglycerol-phosphate dehydratase HisB [Chloroflexota bacterium]